VTHGDVVGNMPVGSRVRWEALEGALDRKAIDLWSAGQFAQDREEFSSVGASRHEYDPLPRLCYAESGSVQCKVVELVPCSTHDPHCLPKVIDKE
jgi:hypothetical protein